MTRPIDGDPYPLPHSYATLETAFDGHHIDPSSYVLLSGNGNRQLALNIATLLGKNSLGIVPADIDTPPKLANYTRQKKESDIDFPCSEWPDGESKIQLHENVRGRQVIIFDSYHPNPDARITQTHFMGSTARLADSDRVSIVTGYFPYARQDRKAAPRTGILAANVANVFTEQGHATRLLSMDLHAEQSVAAVVHKGIPWDIVYGSKQIVPAFRSLNLTDTAIASPDVGATPRGNKYRRMLDLDDLAIVFKARDINTGAPDSFAMIGNVKGMNVVIPDDEVATGTTLEGGGKLVKHDGAKVIYAAAPHGKFTLDNQGRTLVDRIHDRESPIDYLVTLDTIELPDRLKEKVIFVDKPSDVGPALQEKRVAILSAAPIYAVAIMCWLTGDSLSERLIATQ